MLVFSRAARWLMGSALLGIVAAFQSPPEESLARRIAKSLRVYYATALPEKAYLHLDRPYYAAGETVWFRAYAVEADSHRPDTLSKVLYVDLMSAQRRVLQRTLRLQAGQASGDFTLPDTLAAGTYQLRAYTSWMRNAGPDFFFARSLAVLGAGSPTQASETGHPTTPDVHFYPEGGNLVAGMEGEVGFKAVDQRGHGIAVQGTVLDARGQTVALLKTQHLGMGSFQFTPAEGQQYRAVLTLPGGATTEVPLPCAQPAGYGLHVSETADEFVVRMQRRLPAGNVP
ncbi:MG2 domain-containing protein, partial [Hymenobacter agri]